MKIENQTRKTLKIELNNISQTVKDLSRYSTRHTEYGDMLLQSFESFDFQSFKKSLEFCLDYLFDIYGFEDKNQYIINENRTPFCDEIYIDNYQAFDFSSQLTNYISINTSLFLDKFFNETTGQINSTNSLKSNRIFIIHGRDDLIKSEVARFLSHLGLIPIILDEQTNNGRTLFEKLDNNLDVGYAIAIYTPDDIGSLRNEQKQRPRARQNVIFEHGLLVGRIGRKNVFHLIAENNEIETPSDIHGLVYQEYHHTGGWKIKLINELKECGYEIDANKL